MSLQDQTPRSSIGPPPRLFFPATLTTTTAALWTSDFRTSFANSLVVSVTSTFVALVIGVPAA